jgi:hypothetical protein
MNKAGTTALSVPDKYDIIPIHASDVSAFLRCRRYWDWTSPARNNLRKRVEIDGINVPLWFGSGIHYALEMFYNPVLSRDPVEAFETWFNYQWEGGIVTHEWLERTYDVKPITQGDTDMFSIRGLRDMHPDPSHEEFMEYKELGIGMMTFYKEYAAKNDNFIVVSPEAKFSVPLGFEMIDYREQSPNYGKKVEVHARGMRDAITYSEETGKYAIMDHKTAAKVDEDYFTKLDTDPQCSTYIWASIEEAKMYDLPYKEIDSVLYNVLRKTFPRPPTPLKNLTPSVNRTEEGTTAELFEAYVRENGLVEWFENNDKAQGYYSWLLEIGDSNFIQRQITYRNKAMIENTGNNIRAIAKEMLNPKLAIYPHFSGDFMCTRCAFRAPCIAKEDGSDVDFLIDNGYERNRGR